MRKVWTEQMDCTLARLIGSGLSFSQIAARMNVTRNAAIARSHRVLGTVFPSARRRLAAAAHHAAEKKRERSALLADLKKSYARSPDRDAWISYARERGVTLRMIGAVVGLSHQGVQQALARRLARAA